MPKIPSIKECEAKPVPFRKYKAMLLRYNELYSMWQEHDLKDFFRIRPLDSYLQY